MTKRIALFFCAAFSAFALLASTNGVPFMTQHRNMSPTVSVTTNLYGSVTGVVDKAYVEGMAFATTNYVNDKIASIPVGTDTNAVKAIASSASVTNAGAVAVANAKFFPLDGSKIMTAPIQLKGQAGLQIWNEATNKCTYFHAGNPTNNYVVELPHKNGTLAIDADKQDTLVSGTNIKTVNGNSLLGSGNISIESGASDRITNATSVITASGEWISVTNTTTHAAKTNVLCTTESATNVADFTTCYVITNLIAKDEYTAVEGSFSPGLNFRFGVDTVGGKNRGLYYYGGYLTEEILVAGYNYATVIPYGDCLIRESKYMAYGCPSTVKITSTNTTRLGVAFVKDVDEAIEYAKYISVVASNNVIELEKKTDGKLDGAIIGTKSKGYNDSDFPHVSVCAYHDGIPQTSTRVAATITNVTRIVYNYYSGGMYRSLELPIKQYNLYEGTLVATNASIEITALLGYLGKWELYFTVNKKLPHQVSVVLSTDRYIYDTKVKTVNGESIIGSGNIQVGSAERIEKGTNVIYASGEWLAKTDSTHWTTNYLCTKRDLEIGIDGRLPARKNTYGDYVVDDVCLSYLFIGETGEGVQATWNGSAKKIVFNDGFGNFANLRIDDGNVVTAGELERGFGYVTNNVLRGGQVRAITTNGATNEYVKLVPNYANYPYIAYEKYANGTQAAEYNYRLPKKSGTIALNTKTSAAREAVDDQLGDLYDRSDNINAMVNGWENYWSGDKVRLSVTNYYGNTSGELPRLRIEEFDHATTTVVDNVQYVTNFYKTVWDEESRHTNYQAKVDAQIQTISNNVIDAAWRQTNLQLANKAPKNWGSVTSAGQKAPNNTVWMTEPNTVFAGGTEYAHVAVGIGTICVLTDKGAPVYTEGSEGQFRFKDDSGQHYFGFDIRESYTIGCRTDGISVNNNMVTLTYDLTSADNPEILTCTNLNTGTWSPVTVTWETNPPVAGTKICYINVGSNPQGFYKAQMSYAGGSKFVTNMMADFTGGIAATNETGVSTATQVPIYPAATPTGVVWRVRLGN